MPQAIFTDDCDIDKVDVLACAPEGDNINIVLDKYTEILSADKYLVTVQAGIHLGHDPIDVNSNRENNLLYQLHHTYGLALENLGGISHQTVAGFLCTGSSGGSIKYNIHENVHALRFVDGNGEIFEVSQGDGDNFNASLISLGLFGVLSTVTFKCVTKFNISGNQRGTLTHEASVDIFSDDTSDGKIGLTEFLSETEYTRILWWPQTNQHIDMGCDRLQVWQAQRIPDSEDFKRDPYAVFDNTEIMMLYSYLMTLTGNIQSMDTVRDIAATKEEQFKSLTFDEIVEKIPQYPDIAKDIADTLCKFNTFFLNTITEIIDKITPEARTELLPFFTTYAIKLLNTIDQNVNFQDHGFLGLPMDNSADDIIVPVMFTEVWVPLSRATEVTTTLRDYFKRLLGDSTALERTGNNAWELYASNASKAWLSPSYSNGTDVWKNGAFRIDPYWFIHNSASPRDMYRPIWLLLKNNGIPFRLHWAKTFPAMNDTEITAKDLVQDQYPKLQDFLAIRSERDPDGIFLNHYWRHWLGVSD